MDRTAALGIGIDDQHFLGTIAIHITDQRLGALEYRPVIQPGNGKLVGFGNDPERACLDIVTERPMVIAVGRLNKPSLGNRALALPGPAIGDHIAGRQHDLFIARQGPDAQAVITALQYKLLPGIGNNPRLPLIGNIQPGQTRPDQYRAPTRHQHRLAIRSDPGQRLRVIHLLILGARNGCLLGLCRERRHRGQRQDNRESGQDAEQHM